MPDDKEPGGKKGDVVDDMLSELGVDEEMKEELIASGRLKSDAVRVESADEVRRRIDIEKSMERLRDSLNLVERKLMTIDETTDRIERDLIPVILSFLVGLKGNLVNIRDTIAARSKSRAKTALQSTYVESEVKPIIEEEFAGIEASLTSGMSEPVLEKVRDITDGLKAALKVTVEELTTLKGSVDDFTQRSSTEVEFLAKQLALKPKVETPKEVAEELKAIQRKVEELERELGIANQKLETRESNIKGLQDEIARTKAQNEEMESTIAALRGTPTDTAQVAELRQKIKALEASRELLEEKVKEANKAEEEIRSRGSQLRGEIDQKDIQIGDLRGRIRQLEEDISKTADKLAEVEDLRARLRSYEAGDQARETARIKAELERVGAAHERLTNDHTETLERLRVAESMRDAYLAIMKISDKTKAYLTVQDQGSMTIRELARSLGVSPATVTTWAEDYERLGIAKIIDGTTIVVDFGDKEPSSE
ncbi:MAG: helix-turn-helix domain-containing protein [Candidatus Thorarchaeota archaeon]|nr:MAG: helix-turn-helix domain-containing protein [Candidatus Thorarchaeota archaeon]